MAESSGNDGTKDALTHSVIGAAIAVHRTVGPGLLEGVYEACMAHELGKRSVGFERGLKLPLIYDGNRLRTHLRIDLLVENQLVVELKSVSNLLPVHTAQLLTYLKLGSYPRGLLINFNVVRLVSGVVRVAN